MQTTGLSSAQNTSRASLIIYWIITAGCAWELVYGGYWDLSRNAHVTEIFTHLRYPYYLLTILGAWKLAAAVAILIPRFALVKEWAYAGCIFLFSGAAFSNFAVGDVTGGIGPIVGIILFTVSWALRPPSRRIAMNLKN